MHANCIYTHTYNPCAVSDLKALQAMHTAPPSSAALLQSSLASSCELGEAVANTRSALAEVSKAVNAQQSGKRADGQRVQPSAAVAASGEAALAAAQAATDDASARLQTAQEKLAGVKSEEQALLQQLAELQSRSQALQAAAEERAASAASPSQQAAKVQQWYHSTAQKLGSLTGCSVASVKPLSDGTVLATVQLSSMPGATLEVLCAMPQEGARDQGGNELPGHTIKSVAVKGPVPLGASQVAALQLQAMSEGHLGGFQAACC